VHEVAVEEEKVVGMCCPSHDVIIVQRIIVRQKSWPNILQTPTPRNISSPLTGSSSSHYFQARFFLFLVFVIHVFFVGL
jgi:hypothetical protein